MKLNFKRTFIFIGTLILLVSVISQWFIVAFTSASFTIFGIIINLIEMTLCAYGLEFIFNYIK
ncbi:MAG: hypothetical protein PUA55_04830 [Mycoplasma sp.]|nr:hypothetical protein [Mycoplasma sp.]